MLILLMFVLLMQVLALGIPWLLNSYVRRTVVGGWLLTLTSLFGYYCIHNVQAWTLLEMLILAYQALNLIRTVVNRLQLQELKRSYVRTSLQLLGMQVVVITLGIYCDHMNFNIGAQLDVLAVLAVAIAVMQLSTLTRQIAKTTPIEPDIQVPDRDLPTLTVAIPARNETESLQMCLETLLSSDFPKLEILVLDDCSQERRTSEIIRSFAHDGVRFIAGKPTPDGWLPKNFAYQQLAQEANGELILFCGVDVSFSQKTLRQLVRVMLSKRKQMLCVMPRNKLAPEGYPLKRLLIQPVRYAWELTIPRRFLERPPVLSSCWIIARDVLEASGGFMAVKRSISPESFFARKAKDISDGYSFLRSTSRIGLGSLKTLDEQYATAIRSRYPQMHRRPEVVVGVAMSETVALILPLVMIIVGNIQENSFLIIVSMLAFLMQNYIFCRLEYLTYGKLPRMALLAFIPAALLDIGILHISMWKYEFNEIIWKERNICLPVLQGEHDLRTRL